MREMGCVGGCVGGPKRVINQELGRKTVDAYGEKARFETPLENPYVLELLKRLGFDTRRRAFCPIRSCLPEAFKSGWPSPCGLRRRKI